MNVYVAWFGGWLMGLLSPLIVDYLKKKLILKKEITYGLLNELQEAKLTFAANAMVVAFKYGTADRELLLWMRTHATDVKQLHFSKPEFEALSKLIKLSDQDISTAVEGHSELSLESTGVGLSLKKTTLPYLSLKIDKITVFPADVQQLLLVINSQVSYMNQEIDDGRYYFRLTFDSTLSKDNRQSNELNVENSNKLVGSMASKITDRIDEVMLRLQNVRPSR